MLRAFHRKAALTVAAGAALIVSAGPALAAGGWTIAAAPPTGQNATLASVATVSDSDAWAAGYHSGAAFTNVGAKVLIDNWNGTASSPVATPVTPGNTALLFAVSASSATDAWAVGRTQVNKSSFEGLAYALGRGRPGRYHPGFPPRFLSTGGRLRRRGGGRQPGRRLRDRQQRRHRPSVILANDRIAGILACEAAYEAMATPLWW